MKDNTGSSKSEKQPPGRVKKPGEPSITMEELLEILRNAEPYDGPVPGQFGDIPDGYDEDKHLND